MSNPKSRKNLNPLKTDLSNILRNIEPYPGLFLSSWESYPWKVQSISRTRKSISIEICNRIVPEEFWSRPRGGAFFVPSLMLDPFLKPFRSVQPSGKGHNNDAKAFSIPGIRRIAWIRLYGLPVVPIRQAGCICFCSPGIFLGNVLYTL